MDIDPATPVQASAEVFIEAPIDLVWQVHTNLASWPEWNPDVEYLTLRGPLCPGATFHWKARGTRLVSELQELEPFRKIAWTGRALGVRAAHIWHFAESDGGTFVLTEESFEGILPRLFPASMQRLLERSLDNTLEALRREAQRRVARKSKIFTTDEPRDARIG